MQQTWSPYLLATTQRANTAINKSTTLPAMMPMIAPIGSSSSDSVISGVKVTVGVTTEDVTDMVAVGLVNNLGGVTIGITIHYKKEVINYWLYNFERVHDDSYATSYNYITWS